MPPLRPAISLMNKISINIGSFANSMEHRKHIEDELEELGHLHISIPGFFSASSGDVSDWRWVVQAVFDKY